MTTRNLNQTWREVVFQQYASDHAADVPFPVRYLINADQWHTDIWIRIPEKIDVSTFRRSILNFVVARRNQDPVFSDKYISVRPRVSPIAGSSSNLAVERKRRVVDMEKPTNNNDSSISRNEAEG
ncbi:uncharacterized protein CTRU02_215337 [Colletotrichum truncatum]|uniref:Uncharacterized protein n=1 Tax=Colletotrichum truncatum TaxID=5467 RepID=A0ACC3YCW5_COLTU|nr:uncharacterized protein CTRU02_13293 [Colletotrichum truncatum]KAF6783530.1 hypothetical protein CTRU02_13293 [Colletotrichum truncatum]